MPADDLQARAGDPLADDAAEAWFGVCDSGELTAAQKAEFTAWLDASPTHRAAWGRLVRGSRRLDALAAFRPVRGAPDPGLTLGSGALPARSRNRWHFWTVAAAAAAMLAVAGWRSWWQASPALPPRQTAATAVGEMRRLTLADGSSVTLNTRTAVEVVFTASERRVRLREGEAIFTVEKDAARPFLVQAGGVVVRAVGTAFVVRSGAEAVTVMVTEGRVRVHDASRRFGSQGAASSLTEEGDSLALAAGERVVIRPAWSAQSAAAAPTVAPVTRDEIARALAWQERRLEFAPSPLREVVAEFNRYNTHQIVIADARIAELKVGGSFPAEDYATFVRLLEGGFGVAAEHRERETLLRRAAVE